MTEKNIFAYKLFLLLNISDFNLFFMWQLQPPLKKVTLSFPATPSKSWGPIKPPFFENLIGGSTPLPCRKKGGAHYSSKTGKRSFQATDRTAVAMKTFLDEAKSLYVSCQSWYHVNWVCGSKNWKSDVIYEWMLPFIALTSSLKTPSLVYK